MKDSEDFSMLPVFIGFTDSLFASLPEEKLATPCQNYMRGMAHIYRALSNHDTRAGSLGILRDFQKGAGILGNIAGDSLVGADASLGLGTWLYFKSAKAGILRSVMIIKDDRELGLRYLEHSSRSSVLSRAPALHSLVVAYTDMNNKKMAEHALSRLLSINDGLRTPNWDAVLLYHLLGIGRKPTALP
jgi:hypothetical protein